MNNREKYIAIDISLEKEIRRRFNESKRRMQETQMQKRKYEELDEERRKIFGGDYKEELNYEKAEESIAKVEEVSCKGYTRM